MFSLSCWCNFHSKFRLWLVERSDVIRKKEDNFILGGKGNPKMVTHFLWKADSWNIYPASQNKRKWNNLSKYTALSFMVRTRHFSFTAGIAIFGPTRVDLSEFRLFNSPHYPGVLTYLFWYTQSESPDAGGAFRELRTPCGILCGCQFDISLVWLSSLSDPLHSSVSQVFRLKPSKTLKDCGAWKPAKVWFMACWDQNWLFA